MYLSITDCKKIAEKDAITVSANVADYASKNSNMYYVAINTWLTLINDKTTNFIAYPIVLNLKVAGLREVIHQAITLSELLLENIGQKREALDNLSPLMAIVDAVDADYGIDTTDGLRLCLQLLRFLKRFTPDGTDAIEGDCISGFLARNNKAKILNRRDWDNCYFISDIRSICTATLKGFGRAFEKELAKAPYPLPTGSVADPSFSTGEFVRTSGSISLAEKLLFLEQSVCYPILPLLSSSVIGTSFLQTCPALAAGSVRYENGLRCSRHGYLDNIPNIMTTVPKNLDKRRGIGIEFTRTTYLATPAANALRYCLERKRGHKLAPNGTINLARQELNRDAACAASCDNSYATIDCTAASDSVTYGFVHAVLPKEVFRTLEGLRSTCSYIPGKKKPVTLHLFSMMGSRITFPLETLLFYSIAKAACEYVSHFVDIGTYNIHVYGDDVIVPTVCAATVMEWMQLCGFAANEEKSCYSANFYRESCGGEYFHGEDISSIYFPRKFDPLTGASYSDLAILVSLQHRLTRVSGVNAFLTEFITSKKPNMTYSHIGTPSDDLWSLYPVPVHGRDLYDKSSPHAGMDFLESHTIGVTTYTGSPSKNAIDAAQRLAYCSMLRHGPHYDSPLDELLGISTVAVTAEALCKDSSIKYRRKDR